MHLKINRCRPAAQSCARFAAATALTAALAAVSAVHAQSPAGELVVDSPLRSVQPDAPVRGSSASVRLETNDEALAALLAAAPGAQVTVEDFPLAPIARGQDGLAVTLELERINLFTRDQVFYLGDPDSPDGIGAALPTPDVHLFRGTVVGDEDAFVFLSFSEYGQYGYIRTLGVTQVISDGPRDGHPALNGGEQKPLIIYNLNALPNGAIHWRDFVCNAKANGAIEWDGHEHGQHGGVAGAGEPPCRRAEIAIETDVEFTEDLFGGDLDASAAYVATLLGASSEIFTRDVGVEFDVVFVRLWEDTDPWNQNGSANQLFQFRDYWNANMNDVDRHLAHFLSGRDLGGGVAWLDAVCHEEFGYALSGNLGGFFPYPLEDNHEQNWDIMVVTHEFGHNFGTPHTHDYCPPIDECPPSQYFGQCQNSQQCISDGTIMGYCHLCDGGLANVVLEFHPTVRQTILNYLDTVDNCFMGCIPQSEIVLVPQDTPSIQEAILTVLPGGEVIVSPGMYNESINTGGKAVTIRSTDGADATVIDATGINASVARFSNGESSSTVLDGFTLTGGTGSNVDLGGTGYVLGGGIYIAGANPIIKNCIVETNTAQFGGGIFVNDASPTIENTAFMGNSSTSSGGGAFSFSGASPTYTNCTFIANVASVNGGGMSNQGSSPIVTNSQFIENEAEGSGGGVRNIQDSAGSFTDCLFEGNVAGDSGGAMLNEESAGTNVAESTFCSNTPDDIVGDYADGGGNSFIAQCGIPGDLDGSGAVDGADLAILLGDWGSCSDCDNCPADLDGNCTVDGADLAVLLGNWG